MKIIPYVEIDGCRTISDTQLLAMYKKMQDEGNYNKVFYGNGSPRLFTEFLAFLKTPSNQVLVAMENGEPVILAWINEQAPKRGIINFCTFNTVSTRKKLEGAKEMLAVLMKMFLVLIGFTPDTYYDTRKFIRKIGFKTLGSIPGLAEINGIATGMTISYFCKEE